LSQSGNWGYLWTFGSAGMEMSMTLLQRQTTKTTSAELMEVLWHWARIRCI
jgi:hypothetical protein